MAPSQLFPAKLVSAIIDRSRNSRSNSRKNHPQHSNSKHTKPRSRSLTNSPKLFSFLPATTKKQPVEEAISITQQSQSSLYNLYLNFGPNKDAYSTSNTNITSGRLRVPKKRVPLLYEIAKDEQLNLDFANSEMTVAESISKSRGRKREHSGHNKTHPAGRSPKMSSSNETLDSETGRRFGIPNGFCPVVLSVVKPISVQLGLSLIASNDERLEGYFHVRKLLDAGACKQDGRIKIGDVLAMVNGHHLRYWQQMEVINLLRRPLEKLSLVLLREKDPFNIRQRGHYIPNGDERVRSRSMESLSTPAMPRGSRQNLIADEFVRRSNPNISAVDEPPRDLYLNQNPDRISQKSGSAPSLPDLSSKRHSPNPIGYSYEGSSKSASTDKLVSNGHVLSDEDSEDEHDHESVVTSLLNKYNPRRPFDANAKPEPIVYTGKADRKTKEKVDKLKAHSPTKRILQELPPMTERKQRPVSIPKLDLSDAENSDTNLSQFNVNGKETPLYGELDSRRYSQSNAVVPVEHLAASPIPNTNAALEPRFIPEISDADFIDPPQLNLQTVANQPPEERFTNKPPSRFQDTPTASGRISQVPKYHLSKQRNQRPSRSEPRGNSAVEKDKSNLLSAELTKLLEEKRYRKKFENRSKSATEKLQPGSIVTPPKSPYDQYNKKFKSSISQPSSSNENLLHADARQSKTYSFDDQFPNLENKLKPHNSASLVNLDSNSPPLGFKSSPTPYSRIVPATEKPAFVQPSPTNTPQTASPVRPKSRRNWAAENDGGNDFEFADDLLDRVKQISREFDVDPTNPIHEDFGKLPIYTDKNGEKYYQGPGNCSQRPSFIDEDDDSRDYLSFLDDSKVNIDDFSLIDEDRSRKSAYQTPGDIFANGFHSKTEEPGNNSTSPFPPEPMQNYSYMQTNQINDPDFSLQNFAQYSRENSSPGGKSVNSIASTSNTYDILSSPEKINLERSAPQFFNPSTSANELQPMSEENSSDEDLSAFKDSFTPPERQTVTLPDEEILPEKDEPSFSQNSQLERNKPSVFNPQPLSRRHIAPKPQDRANHKEPFARERVPNVTGAQPQDRKISPIHELEEHESPDFKDKMSQRFGSLRVSPPVSHNNPRIEELLNDQLYADSLPQVSRQRPNEFNHVPRSSNSKPLNTSTLESESKNSFTIGLDETEREGEISYASTPTILKDSMVTDCRFSDDPRKRKTKISVPKISKEPNGKTENKPPEKKPVSVVEYNFKTPAAVNLISYDDWKLKFSEDVDPTDKIQKPIKARKTPRVTSSKNRQPSLREKKRRSHASQKSEASRNTTKMPNSNQSTTTNSTQRAKEAPRKHYDHPIKQVRVIPQSQPINSRPEKHMNRKSYDHRPDPNRSKSADTVSMSDPNIPHKEHEPPSYKIGFPVSRNEDDPRSERKRNSSHDEKMGFNVALGSFNKGSSRKNSPSPRSSPKVTPRNSLERGKSPVLRYIPPNSKAPLKKPSPQQPSLVPRLPETKQKIVQPLNFMKLNENDFRAKRNYFEISAKLKDGTNTVKAKDQKQKNASNKTIDPTWI